MPDPTTVLLLAFAVLSATAGYGLARLTQRRHDAHAQEVPRAAP